jgi:hypothetical protein
MYKYITIYICQPLKCTVHVSQEFCLPEYRSGLRAKDVGAVTPVVQLVGYKLVCTLCSLCLFIMRII